MARSSTEHVTGSAASARSQHDPALRRGLERARPVRVPRHVPGNPSGDTDRAGPAKPTRLAWHLADRTRVRELRSRDRSDRRHRARRARSRSDDDPDGMTGTPVITAPTTSATRPRCTCAIARAQIDATITPGADGFSGWKYGLWVLNYLQVMHDANEAPVVAVAAPISRRRLAGNQISARRAGSHRRRHVPRLERHRGLSGAAVHRDDRQPRRRLARRICRPATARRCRGSRASRRRSRYDYASPLRWFPARDRGHRARRQPAYTLASRAKRAARSRRPRARVRRDVRAHRHRERRCRRLATRARVLRRRSVPRGRSDRRRRSDAARSRARDAARRADRSRSPAHRSGTGRARRQRRDHRRGRAARAHDLDDDRRIRDARRFAPRCARSAARSSCTRTTRPDTAATRDAARRPRDRVSRRCRADVLGAARAASCAPTPRCSTTTSPMRPAARGPGWDVARERDRSTTPTRSTRTPPRSAACSPAYLATGDVRYRDRAIAVFDRMDACSTIATRGSTAATPAPVDDVEYTPLRFALLQSTLRDMYELVATRPGGEARVPVLEDRLARLEQARAQRLGRSRSAIA